MNFISNPAWPGSRTAANPGWLPLLLGCALLVVLPGCAKDSPDAKFGNYLNRLARTLAVTPARVAPKTAPVRPSPGSIRIDGPASKLDALDFLALSGCDIQVTIGKRNSSLGRMARASQRLLLDLEYLRLAPACSAYQRQQGENKLADTLDQAWELKRQHLPAMVFNATLGSEEYREFWKRPALQGDYPDNTGSGVITALGAINNHTRRWLAGDFLANNREFELLLGEVAKGDGGALLQALASQAAWLASANQVLEQRLARGPLCSPGRRPLASEILENVVRKYFIGDIQPWSAAVGRRYHELLPPIVELEQLLAAALPPPYRDWQIDRDAQLTTLVQAPRLHVEQLQLIRQPCTND